MKFYKNIELRINGIKPELVIPFQSYEEVSEELQELVNKEKSVLIDIREPKKQRTLEQNSMYWKLVNNIAREIGSSDKEVHLQMLKDYGVVKGVYKVINGKLNEKYFDEIDKDTYKVYKGSSEMNIKEFNRLLEGAIYEAKELGLEVMSYEEYYTRR